MFQKISAAEYSLSRSPSFITTQSYSQLKTFASELLPTSSYSTSGRRTKTVIAPNSSANLCISSGSLESTNKKAVRSVRPKLSSSKFNDSALLFTFLNGISFHSTSSFFRSLKNLRFSKVLLPSQPQFLQFL